jgi:5-methylcytosine-specific restriction endonuclease McrA
MMLRTPDWSGAAKIEKIYKLCEDLTATTGIPHEVDHIIPLKGKFISGLHVPENLQILPREQNRSKYNKFNLEEYNASISPRINPDF